MTPKKVLSISSRLSVSLDVDVPFRVEANNSILEYMALEKKSQLTAMLNVASAVIFNMTDLNFGSVIFIKSFTPSTLQ